MPLSANTSLSFMNPALMFSGPAITRVQASVSDTCPCRTKAANKSWGSR